MNGGFVSSSAPSHQEIADQQSFFSARGLPFYVGFLNLKNLFKSLGLLSVDRF